MFCPEKYIFPQVDNVLYCFKKREKGLQQTHHPPRSLEVREKRNYSYVLSPEKCVEVSIKAGAVEGESAVLRKRKSVLKKSQEV